jgi:hypothetical protein
MEKDYSYGEEENQEGCSYEREGHAYEEERYAYEKEEDGMLVYCPTGR